MASHDKDADFADFGDAPVVADTSPPPVAGLGINPSSRPYTKWYNVHERHSLSEFRLEGYIIGIIAILLAFHLYGSRRNRSKAKNFMAKHLGVLKREFAQVGFGGESHIREKSLFEFEAYATGRQNVAFLDINLVMKKRFNPILGGVEEAKTVPSIPGNEPKVEKSSYDGFVWAVVNKNCMQAVRDERYDASITSTKDNSNLPPWLTVMSESAEITNLLLTPELAEAAKKAGDLLEYLLISDQPTDKPVTLDDTAPRKRVFIRYRLPSNDQEYEDILPIFSYFLRLPDVLVKNAHLRPEVLRKVRATRDDAISQIKKADDDLKAEERYLEREKAKKAKRDEQLKAMDAKTQKKFWSASGLIIGAALCRVTPSPVRRLGREKKADSRNNAGNIQELTELVASVTIQDKKEEVQDEIARQPQEQQQTEEEPVKVDAPKTRRGAKKEQMITVVEPPAEAQDEPSMTEGVEEGLRIISWDDVCPFGDRIEKIAEASYAEVYRVTNERGISIIKVIRLKSPIRAQTKAQERSGLVDEEPHDEEDLMGELQISEWLADIPGFVVYKDRYIVRGKAPKALVETHQAFQRKVKRKDPDRLQFYPSPTRYLEGTKFLVVELGDAGTALEDFGLVSVEQVWDVFLLVAIALARAEDLILFEHRDLHEGNLCIRQVDAPKPRNPALPDVRFGYSGLDITILDYGLSRAEDPYAAEDFYYDEEDEAEDDSVPPPCLPPEKHVEPYARAFDGAPISWAAFAPYTNVLWLAYIYEYLLDRFLACGGSSSSAAEGKRELARFKRETKELWAHLNPGAKAGTPTFGSAGTW
ncbi:unnamed protein product [Parascedosporium putredinis]|uniref:Protein kinase domain-containing protein n=1 Tax=Parascedosporium putredinis TaxID=1442378 RepID=A0A9P1GX37_9PEZI|nr:unnamed protein product [Parascedosporium putredinis]CAI7988670.1 unnamed protein product [Parascedosporium putredinis]